MGEYPKVSKNSKYFWIFSQLWWGNIQKYPYFLSSRVLSFFFVLILGSNGEKNNPKSRIASLGMSASCWKVGACPSRSICLSTFFFICSKLIILTAGGRSLSNYQFLPFCDFLSFCFPFWFRPAARPLRRPPWRRAGDRATERMFRAFRPSSNVLEQLWYFSTFFAVLACLETCLTSLGRVGPC